MSKNILIWITCIIMDCVSICMKCDWYENIYTNGCILFIGYNNLLFKLTQFFIYYWNFFARVLFYFEMISFYIFKLIFGQTYFANSDNITKISVCICLCYHKMIIIRFPLFVNANFYILFTYTRSTLKQIYL